MSRQRSIRRRLLVSLVSALLVVVTAAALVTYLVAQHAANEAYDVSLLDPALDIAENLQSDGSGVRVDLPEKALEALVFDNSDTVVYQVRSPSGDLVSGVADLPPAPQVGVGQHLFSDTEYRGQPVRVVAMRANDGFVVQVGETLNKRNRLVRAIVFAEFIPTLLIAIGAVAMAWLGVVQALQPLGELRANLLRRAPRDLQPMPRDEVVVEIEPVIEAFNRLLADLRNADTMQQRFLANAAHQLRTPLAGLQMHVELLMRERLPVAMRQELERVHAASMRASRLASQLLALAKAEGNQLDPPELEVVDLRSIATAAANDWAPRASARGVDLGFELQHATIIGDAFLLRELLDNLIDNALRYVRQGDSVTLATGSQHAVPYLEVVDSGPGIPAEERSKVVERFYRMPGTHGEGSGLGLAIVSEIAHRHGANLDIRAGDGGAGVAIAVRFPGHGTD